LRLFSFGGYGSALAALALVVSGAYDSYPIRYKEYQSLSHGPVHEKVLHLTSSGAKRIEIVQRKKDAG